MVHLMCKSVAATAREDLETTIRLLYNIQDDPGKPAMMIDCCNGNIMLL